MADSNFFCLIGVMDRLWFHQIILFSDSSTLLLPKTLEQPQLSITESLTCPDSSLSLASNPPEDELSSPPVEENLSSESSSSISLKDDSINGGGGRDVKQKERPTRMNHMRKRVRSHSSSPSSAEKLPRNTGHSGDAVSLEKSMSLGELELEEVKGFMDLGFIFRKEHLSPRMIKVIPGLQRLKLYRNKQNIKLIDREVIPEVNQKPREEAEEEEEEEEEEKGIIRPYLSEAWMIKRPDSPLLNLTMPLPRVSTAAGMKKHLRFWARTVASVIQQEA